MSTKTNIDEITFFPALIKLIKAVAKAAGGTVLHLPSKGSWRYGRIEVDSLPISIRFDQHMQRLKVSVVSPEYTDECGNKQTVWIKDNVDRAAYAAATSEMGFALDRPAEAIARAIVQRLIPEMRGFYSTCVGIGRARERFNADRTKLLNSLAKHFKVEPRHDMLYLDGVVVHVDNNSVRFGEFSVTPETAKKIAALIKADPLHQ